MKSLHFSCREFFCLILLVLLLPLHTYANNTPAWAQNLEFEFLTQRTIRWSLDGQPKLRVQITNKGNDAVTNVAFDFRADDQPQNFPGCATFPNGGFINLEPGESTVVSVWSNCYFGDGLQLPQGTSEHVGEFRFEKAGEQFALRESFTIINDGGRTEPALTDGDNMTIAGTIRIAGGYMPQANLKVKTIKSQEYSVETRPAGEGLLSFEFEAADRSDWFLVLSGNVQDMPNVNFPNKTVKVASFDDPTKIEIDWAPLDYEYQVEFSLTQAIVTPTGFWRGAVSEQERTVVFIPGQENWFGNSDTEKNVYRVQSTIYKYNFDGQKLWEYQPGYECWGGDMSPDGSKVVYQLVPNGGTYGVGVLNGEDGSLLWKKEFTQLNSSARAIEGLEAVLSNDASLVAVGTVPTGVVTLFDANTGDIVRQVPNAPDQGDNWGQIRFLAFDEADEYLYVGSGDNHLRKVRVADGQLIWKAFIGGWPFVNGLKFSSDGSFIITGTKSFDQARVDVATGETVWINDTGSLEAELSDNDRYVVNFGGDMMDAETGEYIAFLRQGAETHFFANDELVAKLDRNVQVFYQNGKQMMGSEPSGGGQGGGEQSQWSYMSADGSLAIIAYRDMVTDPGNQVGIAFYSGAVERVSLDPNDDPTDISLSAASLDENNESGAEIGLLAVTDPDSEDTHELVLVEGAGDNDKFAIDGNKLLAQEVLNYEEKSRYTVVIKATDSNNASFEKSFIVTVNDINDAPTGIELSEDEVAENLDAGATVGSLSATDDDANDTHTFSLVSGQGDTDNASFTIEGGVIKTADLFNFEAKNEYSILVRAEDSEGATFDQQLTIAITNANDAPTDIALSNATVQEQQDAGTEVGTFSTTDEDAEDTHTYSLVAGDGDTDNASFSIAENSLLTTASFDFDSQSSYSIRVRSADASGQAVEKAFTVTVEVITGLEVDPEILEGAYPNPVSDVITIKMASQAFPFQMSMFDLAGNTVLPTKEVQAKESQINVSRFQEGIYLLSIRDAKGKVVRKKILVVR